MCQSVTRLCFQRVVTEFYLKAPGITGVKADNGFTVKQDILLTRRYPDAISFLKLKD